MSESHTPSNIENNGALHWGPRKKASLSDPLVHHGRHFGRTVHALANFQALITNGLLRLGELSETPDDYFTAEQRREHRVFNALLQSIPGLEERLVNGSEEEVVIIADLVQRGASSARSDDTKSIKAAIIDWITPRGQNLTPPLPRNSKMERGFNHECTGALLCPAGIDWSLDDVKKKLRDGELVVAGDQWPIFLYQGYRYDPDDPWQGLFRSELLVTAYKHIFTSPSSVDKEPKATRAGNARIHGITKVTGASIVYVATQVRFALSSSAIFSRTDTTTDSERFYDTACELLDDPEEALEVQELLIWWNRRIFPNYSSARKAVSKNSALAKIREKRAAMKVAAASNTNGGS
ncbi:hypothetical protein BV25DRAFT_1810724 [Artomyces pyxidatus]|uniref:Uncharacterized protein n=1 Tax=Artomyces pyxidatus TaxID=48021 RepID=A0ACB8SQ65_9AGAM|nr:hypothetical protein BV25DRAFT_1810724 [Artomyces pyxidatus]